MGIYTAVQGLTTANVSALYGNSQGRTCDFFANYSGGDFAWARMDNFYKDSYQGYRFYRRRFIEGCVDCFHGQIL